MSDATTAFTEIGEALPIPYSLFDPHRSMTARAYATVIYTLPDKTVVQHGDFKPVSRNGRLSAAAPCMGGFSR